MSEKQIKTDAWTLSVDEDGVLVFPDELCETLGWAEGDELEFVENNDGSFLITKVNETTSN
jgi:bifunctional DNA-binding transcriptional regulator/antitoxin component of YhaV-PrlF toxin-antitoxin module